MVNGCGFAVCDETGAVARNIPATTLKKYICKVWLIIQPLLF
jgi:hypothetical protein